MATHEYHTEFITGTDEALNERMNDLGSDGWDAVHFERETRTDPTLGALEHGWLIFFHRSVMDNQDGEDLAKMMDETTRKQMAAMATILLEGKKPEA